jgi:glutathione synthase/RimK-type ligase-like ATP-grasp enzyme
VNAGRDLEERDFAELLRDISLPAIVKPTSWSGMWGLVEVRDWVELRCTLRLASAADLSVVVQPKVPATRLHSYRLYCVDQQILAAHRFGTADDHVLIGPRHGGTTEWVDPPPELVEDASRIMRLIPVSYLAIDFLTDGERYWFSEVELDASVGLHMLDEPLMLEFLQRRLQSYLRDHRAWLDRRLVSAAG